MLEDLFSRKSLIERAEFLFIVIVDEGYFKIFSLHLELLAYKSDRIVKDVKGGFNDESSKRILF